jgi:hypothetical protein
VYAFYYHYIQSESYIQIILKICLFPFSTEINFNYLNIYYFDLLIAYAMINVKIFYLNYKITEEEIYAI